MVTLKMNLEGQNGDKRIKFKRGYSGKGDSVDKAKN